MQTDGVIFPYKEHGKRLKDYQHNDMLFEGKHFEAFAVKINSPLYEQQYGRLKYVVINFAGLISKVSADMLFGEPIRIKATTKAQQSWLADLMFENKFGTQLYESAMINSRLGDDVLKIRTGKRRADDTESTIFIEEVRPDIYFVKHRNGNWRADPEYQELAFKVQFNGKEHVRIERHYPGRVENYLYVLEKEGKLGATVPIELYDPGLEASTETGIDRSLIVHVPNWRAGNYYGISDYTDIESLMYALNNRMTKNENVLDKHTDPILALPEGILDAKGEIRKDKLEVFTIPDNEVGGRPAKPEYITWNASLDNSFKQIDQLVEFLFMVSETSPGVFGLDKQGGAAESGRALKLKLMRTIAKINRKKVFYDQAIKEVMYVAQLLAQTHGYKVLGNTLPGAPEVPEIIWQDGLPVDDFEQVELEAKRLEAGVQSKQDAIATLDDLDDDDAAIKVERIKTETSVPVPVGATVPAVPGDDDEG